MANSVRVWRWAALAAAGAVVMAGCSSSAKDDDSSPEARRPDATPSTPTPSTPAPGEPGSATPAPGATPVPVPADVVDATGEVAEDYADSVGDVLADPTTEDELTLDAVTGAALEDLRNQVAEYEASGWRVVGRPTVVRHRVVAYYDDPELAIVRACIDNSSVKVVDAEGNTVPGSRPARPRTLNLLTLVKEKGAWVVAEQRPATKPNC